MVLKVKVGIDCPDNTEKLKLKLHILPLDRH